MSPSSPPTTPIDQEDDGSQADSKRRLGLSRTQEELRDALARVDPRLGSIYAGGLRVLEDDSNPDRLAQSAHSMRELMEKIEEWFARKTEGNGGRKRPAPLKAEIGQVEVLFLRRKRQTGCYSDESGWTGEIDHHLRKVLDRLDGFFEWFAEEYPRRRALFEQMLIGLDPSGLVFPPPLVDNSWRQWRKIRDYFVNVSHHRRDTSLDTLREQTERLENFLADRLLPRTSAELDVIDAIIEEARDA